MDLQPISTLSAAITMAYEAETKMEKKQKSAATKRNTWDKSYDNYQRRNSNSSRQFQISSTSTSKAREEHQVKTNQGVQIQETPIKKSGNNHYQQQNLSNDVLKEKLKQWLRKKNKNWKKMRNFQRMKQRF